MTTALTIKDKNVYYAGKVVGTVSDIQADDKGIRCIIKISDPKLRRYLTSDVSDLTLTV